MTSQTPDSPMAVPPPGIQRTFVMNISAAPTSSATPMPN